MTLEFLTSDTLTPIRHGFFTRAGGASLGIFAGLNCGMGSCDKNEFVSTNRARVAKVMDVAANRLIGVHQVHSTDVVVVDRPFDIPPKADGLVTRTSGIALSILTADCQPVLFADAQSGVIGAAHAGWKGTQAGILEATIDKMIKMGAKRTQIHAVIGPTISQRAYEVGPEFRNIFLKDNPMNTCFFAIGKGDRMHFDLPSDGLLRLRACGIASATWTQHCTYFDPKRFFSYRRSVHNNDADYGRLISTIKMDC